MRAGAPEDGRSMETLWAPWRMAYITGPREGGCVLCEKAAGTPLAAEALMGVGRCYEALTRVREAQAIYTEVVKKYPETVWGSLAERRLAFLEAS